VRRLKSWLKSLLLRAFPNTYDNLIRFLSGPSMRAIRGTWNRMKSEKLVRSGRPFRVDIVSRMGFGASLTNAVFMWNFFRDCPGFRGVVSSNPLYQNKEISSDVFDMYFQRVGRPCESDCATISYRFPADLTLKDIEDGLTLRDAHELFYRNFTIKEQFVEEARALFTDGFKDAVGVHFRGSDKRLEVNRIAFEDVVAAVDLAMEVSGFENLFVATDEAAFLEFAEQLYGKHRTRSLECKHLSDGISGAHYLSGDGFQKGREALVTLLALSMCKLCVRAPSHLSAWAKILNLDLAVMMFGTSTAPPSFPEAEIARIAIESSVTPALN
jgi:hypothetical protein